MKRVSKLLLTFVLVLSLMTGCVKYDVSMEVKDDKSVTLEILYGMEIDTSMMEDDTDTSTDDDYYFEDDSDYEEEEEDSSVSVEDYKYLEEAGYKVEEYKEETEDKVLGGVKITKTFKNIDDITSDKKIEVDFQKLFEEENKDKLKDVKFFYKEDGNYKANLIFDFSTDDGMDYSSYQSMFDLKYSIKLPTEAVSNNAKTVSEDKKELTWEFEYGKKNTVEFAFKLANNTIYIIIGAVAGVAVLAVLVVVMTRKPKPVNMSVAPVQQSLQPTPGAPDLLAAEPVAPVAPAAPQIDPFAAQPVQPMVDGPAISFDAPAQPVIEAPAAPVMPAAPVVEAPVAPVAPEVAPAPVMEAPVAPVAAAPVVEAPVAPVAHEVVAAPVMEAPAAPVAPATPVVETPVAPVAPEQNNNGVM